MDIILLLTALSSALLTGAIFGFFYAWSCACMWGFDEADPKTAIRAMQAINNSVQNAAFAPAFFLPPVALLLTAWVAHMSRADTTFFIAAAILYLVGGVGVTVARNVPLNQLLAETSVPESETEAARLWQEYSRPWQRWNAVRTAASGVALLFICLGLIAI